ncbi:MAG: Peptidoglycan D,D-transpeptidase MrdA, partial [uncultured Sphingomonadaceae bacterium]
SQQLLGRDRPRRMEDAVGRRAPPAQQQGSGRSLPARLDDQADGGDGVAGERRRPGRDDPLRRRLPPGQPHLPLPRPPRQRQHDARDRQELQHLLLRHGPAHRLRRDLRGRQDHGARRQVRASGGVPILRHGAVVRVETAQVQAGLDAVGYAQRVDRPGLPHRQSAPARRDECPHRVGPRGRTAPRHGRRAAARLDRHAVRIFRDRAQRDERGRQRRRHRWPVQAAARRRADGRQDGHRAGAPNHGRAARAIGRVEVSRPRAFRLLRARRQAALRRVRRDRSRHGRLPRRRACRARRAHLPFRQEQGDGDAARVREGLGRHDPRTHGRAGRRLAARARQRRRAQAGGRM